MCTLLFGCASAPEPRPLAELVDEAREASRSAAKVTSTPATAERPDPVPPQTAHSEDRDETGDPQSDTEQVGFEPALDFVYQGPLVTETFIETDIREALQILAEQGQVSLIADDQARGVTSVVINNQPFEVALDKILAPLGYVWRQVEGQYLVGVPDPASSLFSRIAERHDYYTRYLPPSELMQLLPEQSRLFVRTSEKRNLIIVEAPPQIAESILEDLGRSDQPVGQVVLEAFVCVITPESGLQFGFDVEQGIPLSGGSALNLALSGLDLAGGYGTSGVSDFAFTSALLKSLAREGYVSIRAAPRVMAKDGETATISIAKETFFSVQPGSAQLLFRQDIEKIEAGISLDITPVIRGNHITVEIERAEVSEGIDSNNLVQGQLAFPIINRRRVATTVHVRDGETITIGGLVQRQQVERVNKLPVLGDIPYVGGAFQSIDRREEDAEVVIFISPRIVREDAAWIEQPPAVP